MTGNLFSFEAMEQTQIRKIQYAMSTLNCQKKEEEVITNREMLIDISIDLCQRILKKQCLLWTSGHYFRSKTNVQRKEWKICANSPQR